MAVLIYSEQAADKLKLLAEVGEDNVELAVDALLDAEPKFANQQPFVVFPVDARMIVEAGEIVRPRRDIRITGGDQPNGSAATKPRATRTRQTEPQVDEGEVETEPAPATEAPAARRPRAKSTNGRRKQNKGKKGSPFTRNPASDE